MEVKLIVLKGKMPANKFRSRSPEFVIGRDRTDLARSEEISRRHCVIAVAQGSVTVRDLGSKNGTFVNQRPIKGERS